MAEQKTEKSGAIFFDLQGTLGGEPLGDIRDFSFYPHSLQSLALAQKEGFSVFIITNQSHISKGLLTMEQFEKLAEQIIGQIRSVGGKIEKIYCCPHLKAEGCTCKKPSPYFIRQAMLQYHLNPRLCYMVGDIGQSDMLMAQCAGVKGVLVRTGHGMKSLTQHEKWPGYDPTYVAQNVLDAVNWIFQDYKKMKKEGNRMQLKQFKILSPCGILGYGYPLESFQRGIEKHPDAIVVDAGSTDAGPHKLGLNTAIVSRQACKKDLVPMLKAGAELNIPVIIGSAGGSGGKQHVLWAKEIIDEILKEEAITGKKVAIIWADIPKKVVAERQLKGDVNPLGLTVKELTPERLEATTGIVAQMGHEPVLEALKGGADIIICGRAYDPSPFAAVAVYHGFDMAYAYHLGKVLECAALCTEPGTTKDCMMGIVQEDGFVVESLNPMRRCTSTSVAAHTFYEKDHPYILHGPGWVLDLKDCNFTVLTDTSVKVTGSKIYPTPEYRIKLEGAIKVAYRTFVIAGIRDEILISRIEEVEQDVVKQVQNYYSEIPQDSYSINFINYGLDGVMGEMETNRNPGHELGVMFEVLAPTQELANAICASTRSTFLHFGYVGRKSTAGNLAFPFAPSDVPFGPVCEFSVYHLMTVSSGLELFPIEYYTV